MIVPLHGRLDPAAFALLVAGGVFYTAGTPVYLWPWGRFNHAVWHLFVLAGSACHVALVLGHVLPG